ncbi:hypothetical protein E4V51_03800 [Paenibacillus sp. 28ISP30-2]|uniref:SMI1/KNR4 family protein n=1 Tax=Paenibacillus sp. 23TSA30-6 TaxID=2546104 RepID=UPI001787D271|nr:SMI1/KNR4 family protein [Paenibacillus sp. 23TSA30-6]MBE0336164.1 hypothetical protein [Paenibacillus sp. 23TSA30-6]MBE0340480.1 hypothetical protein [Paenibacillus sp. 28ISP30-2]
MRNTEELEKYLNIKIPESYIKWFSDTKEYRDEHNIILKSDHGKFIIKQWLDMKYSGSDSIGEVYMDSREQLLDGVVPIAFTELDDYVCLFYNKGRQHEPSIILWDYELALEELEEGLFHLADDFHEFTKMLICK